MKYSFVTLLIFVFLTIGCASTPPKLGKTLSRNYGITENDHQFLTIREEELDNFAQLIINDKLVVSTKKQFKRIHGISDKRAVVKDSSGKLSLYEIEDDELYPLKDTTFEIAPSASIGDFRKQLDIVMTHSGGTQNDITVYPPKSTQAKVFKNLGGEAVMTRKRGDVIRSYASPATLGTQSVVSFNNFFVIHSLAEDQKTPVSQMISLEGEVLSPRVGYIYRAIRAEELIALSEVGDIPGAYFTGQKLYRPMDSSGKFLPLPENALGVLPMRDNKDQLIGWLIMFPDDKGLVGSVYWGKISEISKAIITDKRIIDYVMPEIFQSLAGPNWNLAYQGYDGKWYFDPQSSTRAINYGVGSQYLPTREAFLAYVQMRNEEMKIVDKAQAAAKFKAWEDSTRAAREAQFAAQSKIRSELSDEKNLCNRFQDAVTLGKEMVATYLAKCEVNDEYIFKVAESMGIQTLNARNQRDERLAKAKFRLEEERARAAERGGGGLLQHLESQNGPGLSNQPVGAAYDASKGSFGTQQQRYQWEKQLNQQLYNKPYDPTR